jgi:hypothetical protein
MAVAGGLAAAVAVTLAQAVPAGAVPVAPNLDGYQQTAVDPYVDNAAAGGEVYFQTPDGLLCAIRPAMGSAGCDGSLPAAPAGANEIVLSADLPDRGFHGTANPRFVKPSGGAAAVLPVGHKIVFSDFECAVGDGGITVCTKGNPVERWMVLSPSDSGIGPPTAGLPDDFPDPNDYVSTDQSYVVGAGPKNMFPTFTVANGLTCRIIMYSGGEIGCDGTLPGVGNGENEVFAKLPGDVGLRKTDAPNYRTPNYPGPVRQLPAGNRISELGATCMATEDGGVSCYGSIAGQTQGFAVSNSDVRTFGG